MLTQAAAEEFQLSFQKKDMRTVDDLGFLITVTLLGLVNSNQVIGF